MRSSDLSRAAWRKSSRSNGGVDGACVEVAALNDRVALRDSKHPAGAVLTVPQPAWRAFIHSIRTAHFD